MYVLDTDVLSLTSPTSKLDGAAVERWREWVLGNRHRLFLSTITLMEIRFGIEKLRAKGAEERADLLQKWLLAVETVHAERLLPIDPAIAKKAGELLHSAVRRGSRPSSEDALIAATGAVSGFRVLSRNRKDMQVLGADWIDPLGALPSE
jgi:predicted nucleic acid-binding protein